MGNSTKNQAVKPERKGMGNAAKLFLGIAIGLPVGILGGMK